MSSHCPDGESIGEALRGKPRAIASFISAAEANSNMPPRNKY